MKRYGFGLPETHGTRCEGRISDRWVVSKLQDDLDPERPLAWELLIRKATFFSEHGWRRHPELWAFFCKEDLEQDLLLHIHQISLRPNYQGLHWSEFSKILTVALPNRIKNLRDRVRITPYFSLYSEGEIEKALNQQVAPPQMHLSPEALQQVLQSFRKKLRGEIQDHLGQTPAMSEGFQNLAEEILWVLERSQDTPGKSFQQILRLLGYRGTDRLHYLAASLQECLPEFAQSLSLSDVCALCGA
jgi:hypothetical protein